MPTHRGCCFTRRSLLCWRPTSLSGPSTSLNATTCPNPSRPWRWKAPATSPRRGIRKATESSWWARLTLCYMHGPCLEWGHVLLLQLMLQSWNNLIFDNVRDRLLSAAMKFLYDERSGEAFDSQLVIGVRESFGQSTCVCSNEALGLSLPPSPPSLPPSLPPPSLPPHSF